MKKPPIKRVNYRNVQKQMDFEIVDVKLFFATRPKKKLESEFRLNFWSILYITEGSGDHYVDFVKYPYKKGDIIFVQMNQVHKYSVNSDVQGYLIHINEPFFYGIDGFNGDVFLEFVDRSFGSPVISFDTSTERTNRLLIDLIYREYSKNINELNVKLIATLFQGFILSLENQVPKNDKILESKDYENYKEYRKLVEEHYHETRNVEDYAKMMLLSKKTINQATRKVVGLSAKEYIINRIILEIKRYLSQGELMNYEIADLLGFGEAGNMTKFFKRYEGLSPKEFKEQIK